jgi:galactokinase
MADTRARRLRAALGAGPVALVRAPGRVNLMGDHTDYNDGLVLPLAIDRDCLVAWRHRHDERVTARSLELDGAVEVGAGGGGDPAAVDPPWGRLVAGVVRALAERGRQPVGLDLVLSSTVPAGSGLSSSAALEVAVATALVAAAAFDLPGRELALACQEAEHLATGVPSGIMDQLTSVSGRAGHALLIDCRSLAVEPVMLPPRLAVLVVHSGVGRILEDSAYAERRAACRSAATRLGVAALRDARPEQVAGDRRARHVVAENRRVLETADALRDGDNGALGALLLASHTSLRDDYEVSTPQLDLLVELLVEHGALGARLTGAGFGGCVVAVVPRHHADDVAAKTARRYRDATGLDPAAFVVRAVDGAGPLTGSAAGAS